MARLAVCIPSKNRHSALQRSLLTVVPAARAAGALVWICDQSAVPCSVPARYADTVRVLHRSDLGGLPAARNALINACTDDVLVFLDDDSDLAVDALTALLPLIDAEPQIVGWGAVCETRSRRVRALYRCVRLGALRDPRRLTGARCDAATTLLFGCAMAFRRSALLHARGCDARLPGYGLGEDADLCLRVQRDGKTLRFVAAMRAWHRRDGENRHDPIRQWRASTAFIRWWSARHGHGNPATVVHAMLAWLAMTMATIAAFLRASRQEKT